MLVTIELNNVPKNMRKSVVACMHVGSELSQLAKVDDMNIVEAVAGNKFTPVETLYQLACDDEVLVREEVSRNQSSTPEILEKLASDEEVCVRKGVASNPSTPEEILESLENDERYVQISLWRNPKVPKNILGNAITTELFEMNEFIIKDVLDNPDTPLDVFYILAKSQYRSVRTAVAASSRTTPDLLKVLAHDDEEKVREAVAKNPHTRGEVLDIMSDDKDEIVCNHLAANPSTPPQTLTYLTNRAQKWENVVENVARNPNTKGNVLRKLIREYPLYVAMNPSLPQEFLIQLSEDEDDEVRMLVAKNPATAIELLEKLSKDRNYRVRLSVARNATAGEKILSQLEQDPNVHVRYAAQEESKKILRIK